MRIRKSTLKRIIAESASEIQMARLEDAVRGQDIEIAMGGYLILDLNLLQYLDRFQLILL